MTYSLYLDDIRIPKFHFDEIARSFEEAKEIVLRRGTPKLISFDHDLGEFNEILPTGKDFANWLIEQDINGVIDLKRTFCFRVHSANPIGAENIRSLLSSYLREKFKK